MKRLLWCALAAFACGPSARPAGHGLPTIAHYDTRLLRNLTFDDSVRGSLVALYHVAQVEGLEAVACLYGRMAGPDVFIDEVRPGTVTARLPHAVFFERGTSGCPETRGLVGTFHTHLMHPQGVMLRASIPDLSSFFGDPRLLLILVGVGPAPDVPEKLLIYWTLRHGNFGYLLWP